MADDIKKIIEDTVLETSKHHTRYLQSLSTDVRDLGVVMEDVQSDVKHIAEAVDTHTQQLERLEPMQGTLEQVRADVDVVKTTLEQVSLVDLKQELGDLKKRVEEIESRIVK